MDGLKKEIQMQLGVSTSHQLVFSPASPYSLSPHTTLSPDHFSQLMEKCGASRGNGLLYLLPINELQSSEGVSDAPCLAQLSELPWCFHSNNITFSSVSEYAVSDQNRCVELITDVRIMMS